MRKTVPETDTVLYCIAISGLPVEIRDCVAVLGHAAHSLAGHLEERVLLVDSTEFWVTVGILACCAQADKARIIKVFW